MKKLIFFSICLLVYLNGAAQAPSKTKLFFEKAYLRTDQDAYIAGNTLWYSAFLVNAQDNHFINTSKTLYVELVSAEDNYQVQKQIIELNEGKGFGDFELDDSLKTGTYFLRAWTNWMRNFNDNFLFEKHLVIAAQKPKVGHDKLTKKSTPVATGNKAVNEVKSDAVLAFFPEGGSLLNDVPNIVAFKALNSNANASISGTVYNKENEAIAEFESKSNRGLFLFQPIAGEVYYAKGKIGASSFRTDLPKALEKGYALQVIEKDSLFQVVVKTNQQSNVLNKDVLLTASARGLTYVSQQFNLKNLQQGLKIYKNTLPQGVVSFTLYDAEGRPNCERLVFVENTNKSVNVEIANSSSSNKELIQVKTGDDKDNLSKSAFSIAVLKNTLALNGNTDIYSYLFLTSELRGEIEKPNQYFSLANTARKQDLNLLLLTQGWRNYLWQRIADTSFVVKDIPEQGITLSGTVSTKVGDKPIEGANVTIRAAGKEKSGLFWAKTDRNGNFFVDDAKFLGEQLFRVNAVNDKAKNVGWLKLDPLFKSNAVKPSLNKVSTELPENVSDKLFEQQDLLSKGKSMTEKTIELEEVKVKGNQPIIVADVLLNDFGYKDEVFDITDKDHDYQNLSHYLLANSKQAGADTGANNYIVFRYGGQIIYPRFVINGRSNDFFEDDNETLDEESMAADVEVRNNIYDTYLNMPMSDIKNVTIKHLVRATGGASKDYFVVFLTLREGATLGAKVNPVIVRLDGYYKAKEFFPSDVNKPNQPQNALVYWNPIVETDAKGTAEISFQPPADKTDYYINIQGINARGIPFVLEKRLDK
ncbi:hypothetical protein [Pelobium manganitolerans]|uniref:hypothetical protein n=1 Tax=Pelobium manganitolerans TaxID=1842495 RepID=UPI003FA3BD4B